MSPDINMDDESNANSAIRSFLDEHYKRMRFYEELLVAVENKCHHTLAENKISHFTESRVKDGQSLRKKLDQRKGVGYSSVKKIEEDIVDICGVRIIFHYMTDQHKIKGLLESIFRIESVKVHSGGREHTQNEPNDKWGYQLPLPDYIGTHYRCFVKPEVLEDHFQDLSVADRRVAHGTMIEVQVRSIMDDIWARYAHCIYKSEAPGSKRQQSMLRDLRMGLEGVRNVTIEMQKLALHTEEKSKRKFETNDQVGTYFQKVMRVEYELKFTDHKGAFSEALKYLLESIDSNTPASFHKLIKRYDWTGSKYEEIKRLYGSIEFNVVLYLLDRVLLSHNSQDETILGKEEVSANRKMEIIMSTILWMNKLLQPSIVWIMHLASTPPQQSPRDGLKWLSMTRQYNSLARGRNLDDNDKATLDELWNLFENYDQRPIKLAFAMSSRGMIRDVASEREDMNRVIKELSTVPNFRDFES